MGQQTTRMTPADLAAFLHEQAEWLESGEGIPDFTTIRVRQGQNRSD
jgi:hypothetical protein